VGETFTSFYLDHSPAGAILLNTAAKRGIARWKQYPIVGYAEDAAIGAHYMARL
jgi:hypothetical protein